MDFGFSKSTEEALKIWDSVKVLGDVVWVIRKFKPDVIITRFLAMQGQVMDIIPLPQFWHCGVHCCGRSK
jgi:hypothetical protein